MGGKQLSNNMLTHKSKQQYLSSRSAGMLIEGIIKLDM
jgi:hypothetical protein